MTKREEDSCEERTRRSEKGKGSLLFVRVFFWVEFKKAFFQVIDSFYSILPPIHHRKIHVIWSKASENGPGKMEIPVFRLVN